MKKILIIMILAISAFMVSCGVFTQYEDTNGTDNYALQSITEEMLIKKDI